MFNKYFNEYLHRNYLDVDSSSSSDFVAFVKKYGRVICKPVTGGQGKGIHVYEYSNDAHALGKYKSLKGHLIEEIIVQHPDMAKLNPTSVNTVRVVTFNYHGKVNVLSCALRTGVKGAVTDNISGGEGQCWAVDISSGIVFTPSFGYNYQSHIFHLGSGYQVLGFQIPNWKLVIETVKDAAAHIPSVAYIGWDVAITESGVCLIEGNHDPGHGNMQMMDQKGKYTLIQKIISE